VGARSARGRAAPPLLRSRASPGRQAAWEARSPLHAAAAQICALNGELRHAALSCEGGRAGAIGGAGAGAGGGDSGGESDGAGGSAGGGGDGLGGGEQGGKYDFNVALINLLDEHSVRAGHTAVYPPPPPRPRSSPPPVLSYESRRAQDEPYYGMGAMCVSWHADDGVAAVTETPSRHHRPAGAPRRARYAARAVSRLRQRLKGREAQGSAIAVYNFIPRGGGGAAAGAAGAGEAGAGAAGAAGGAWRVGLKVSWDVATPAVAVPMASGEGCAPTRRRLLFPPPAREPPLGRSATAATEVQRRRRGRGRFDRTREV